MTLKKNKCCFDTRGKEDTAIFLASL